MKQPLQLHALIATLILALLATACGTPAQDTQPQETPSCGDGEEIVIDDAVYCVFKQAVVIENGFSCPIDGQMLTVREPIGVCGQQHNVPPQRLDEIDEVYAEREPEVYQGYCSEVRDCSGDLTCQQRTCVEPEVVVEPPDPSMNDTDGDGLEDDQDNCPMTPNGDQTDTDNDGAGDACDENACSQDADCAAGETCTMGACVADNTSTCTSDADCGQDEGCVDSACVACGIDHDGDGEIDCPLSCSIDADCIQNQVCANGTCLDR